MGELRTLVDRLRGHYRIPINDGLGPAGGDEPSNPDAFVRTFETPPIQHEAAAEITRLREAIARADLQIGDRHIANARKTLDAALEPT